MQISISKSPLMLSNFELDLCMLVTINMYSQHKSGRGQMILGTYRKFHISCQLWLQSRNKTKKKKCKKRWRCEKNLISFNPGAPAFAKEKPYNLTLQFLTLKISNFFALCFIKINYPVFFIRSNAIRRTNFVI